MKSSGCARLRVKALVHKPETPNPERFGVLGVRVWFKERLSGALGGRGLDPSQALITIESNPEA